ncbi:MAG TPA: PQQ-binding-like beta-propeller repeat protein, partial [Gemmataceae bacterium]|nr:PQQ-binding-like beta-propeller repeat protein [Gemmataceae bacterium]
GKDLPNTAAKKKATFDLLKSRIEASNKVLDTKGIAGIPGLFPLASAGKVIFRGYDGVYCIATKEDKSVDPPIQTGELLWKSETEFGLYQMLDPVGKRNTAEQWLSNYAGGPFGILTENPLTGTLSHDGQNVYFVDDLAVPPHPNFWGNARMQGTNPAFGAFQDAVYASKLKAVNLETGKLMWKLGESTPNARRPSLNPEFDGFAPPGRPAPKAPVVEPPPVKQTSETFLADALFLGPPLPLAGKLYVVVEKDGLFLVCLDPGRMEQASRQTSPIPSLVWTQKLGDPNGALPEDALRRYQGIHLAYKDGVLVVPTNAGAVLGIDLFSHSLIWAAAYKSNKSTNRPAMSEEMMMQGRFRPGMAGGPQTGISYDLARERWHASAPIVVGNRVVFTAFDSDTVECVDLHDGRSVWKAPIAKLESDLYVAGVFDEKVLIVGKGYVRFHSLATGQQLRDPLLTGVPTGVGAATEGLYFLPIKASKDKSLEPGIVAIDYKTMQAKGTSRSRKKETAGNLLFHDGDLFSVTPAAVASFQQLASKIRETEERLGKNPNDPVGLVDLAMLQHDDGRLVPAIANYQKALAGQPPEELRAKGREKLFEAITELLQNDFAAGENLLPEYQKLCTVEVPESATDAQKKLLADEELRRKSNYHALVANGKEKQGKLLEAFEAFMAYGTLVGNKEMVVVPDEPNTQARPDVWARARILNMIKKATPEQRKPLENKVVEEWTKVKAAADMERLRGFVKVFGGMFEAGSEARIMLADRLAVSASEDDVREAEYMLLSLRRGDDPVAAASAVEALSRLYIRKGLLDDAVGMYIELDRRFGTTPVRNGRTGAEVYSELVTDKRFLPYLEPPVLAWPYPKMRQGELVSGSFDRRANLLAVPPGRDALPFYRRYKLSISQSSGWVLNLTDRVTGKDETVGTGMGYQQYQPTFQQNSMRYMPVQVKGHVAVVTMHTNNNNSGGMLAKVYAYDLADRKKLWDLDLLGAAPGPAVNPQPVSQGFEADGYRVTFQDGWSVLVGQSWVVEDTYTVVLTRDGLVAKDNARGTVLWTKANVSPRTHLVGDGDLVFAYDANPDGGVSPVRCYRAADGVEVSIPDSSGVFTNVKKAEFYGRKVLVADDGEAKKSVRLYDLVAGKDLWKHDLPGEGGWVVKCDDPDYAGYVSAAGDVAVFAVEDGKEVFRAKLDEAKRAEHLAKVTEAVLFADGERFFVALNKPHENNMRFGYNPVFGQSIRSVRVNGVMYAFDRKSARRLWHTDEQLADMNVALDQFAELPLIFAAANQMKMNANGGIEGQHQRFAVLDKASGKLKYNRTGVIGQQYSAIIPDPKTGYIEVVTTGGQRVRFTPDDGRPVAASEPPPVEPKAVPTARPAIRAIKLAPAVAAPPPPPKPK